MADLKEYVSQPQELGTIHISEEVIASIAGVAAAEVEGVSAIVGGRELNEKSKSSPAKGVHLQVSDGCITVELSITVSSVSAVRKVAEQVQDAVISSIRDMTGLEVNQVNVNVTGITF